MSRPSSLSKPRAVLGAMSWRLPEDDWTSPWSFEGEWTPPQPQSAEEKRLEAELQQAGLPILADESAMAADRMPPIATHGTVLRFEPEEAPEPPPPPAAKAVNQEVKEIRVAKEADDVRFRPPGLRPPSPVAVPAPAPQPVKEVLPPPAEPRTETRSRLTERETAPVADPQRKRELRNRAHRQSWGTLISLSLGTLGFTLLAWIYLHDSPRESDEDLRTQTAVDQTPVIQAPLKLRAFLDSVIPVENVSLRSQPAWAWDTPSLATFIRVNGTAFDNLRDLLEDYDWHPHHAAWYREDASTHPAWPHAACLLQAQAAYLARRGDEEPAFVAAIDLAEMARRLQDVWAWPGYMRRGLELQTAAAQTLAELLKATLLDGPTLGRFQKEFTQCQPDDGLLRQACAAYYLHEKKLLLGPASGELLDTMPGGRLHQRPGRLFFKMNETLGLFASAFRDLRDEISRPPYTRLSVAASPSSRIRLTKPRFYHPNSNGETYFSNHIEPHLTLPQDHSLAQARHGLVRCLFALRRYLAERQTLPGTLTDLSPTYLLSLPVDPFSGEPLQYEAASGRLYSVGVNLIAEGGRVTSLPMEDDREPTVELGIAMAVPVKK